MKYNDVNSFYRPHYDHTKTIRIKLLEYINNVQKDVYIKYTDKILTLFS